jgi:phosphatidylglycerol:prolipoprotein diacylglycerol transferase
MPDGSILALFLILYSIFRFITEYFREPTAYIGPLTMGQALNIPMFIVGVGLWFYAKRKS